MSPFVPRISSTYKATGVLFLTEKMNDCKPIQYFSVFLSSITIEPVIFLSTLGWSLISGAEISKKLFMFQICSVGLNFSSADCENLTAVMTTAEKISVQESLNNLLMKSQFISSLPAIVYSVIAGGFDSKKLFYLLIRSDKKVLIKSFTFFVFLPPGLIGLIKSFKGLMRVCWVKTNNNQHPSSIRCRGSNLRPLSCEPSALTSKPWLLAYALLFLFLKCVNPLQSIFDDNFQQLKAMNCKII